MGNRIGLVLIVGGVVVVLVGILVSTGLLSWFGRLPGDVRIENERTRIYIPFTSMVLTSLALTLVANLVRRFF